jgi:hypothetical protein
MLALAAARVRGKKLGGDRGNQLTDEARAAFATWAGYLREALDGARAAEEAKAKSAAQ